MLPFTVGENVLLLLGEPHRAFYILTTDAAATCCRFQRVEKELAFQRAYDQAWKRFYSSLTPICNVAQPRLALFVSEKSPDCETLAQKLINDDRPLDINSVRFIYDILDSVCLLQTAYIDRLERSIPLRLIEINDRNSSIDRFYRY